MKNKATVPKGLLSRGLLFTAVLSVRRELKVIFLIAFVSILLIELYLKNISAPFSCMPAAGEIYLKLSYSLFASIIFYFINVQIPKEQKKLKSFVFVYNRIKILMMNLDFITERLGLRHKSNSTILTRENFKDAMAQINPHLPVETYINKMYANWRELIIFLINETKTTLHDLLPLHDNIDGDLLECLFQIENTFNYLQIIESEILLNQNRWLFISTDFYNIWYFSNKCSKLLAFKYNHTFKQLSEKHYREHTLPESILKKSTQ